MLLGPLVFTVRLPPPMLVVSDLVEPPLPAVPSSYIVRVVKNPPMKELLITSPSPVAAVLNESKVKAAFAEPDATTAATAPVIKVFEISIAKLPGHAPWVAITCVKAQFPPKPSANSPCPVTAHAGQSRFVRDARAATLPGAMHHDPTLRGEIIAAHPSPKDEKIICSG